MAKKKTPLQIVKDDHGSKDALVDKVAALVDREDGESEEDHKKRLKLVPNAKLLHLLAVGEKAKALGGRDGIVARILELKNQSKDHEFGDKLKKTSLGRLIDTLQSLERAAKKKAG
ncbi:MAG: hypothetical protein H6712_16575 [Myxococcales bacterium]|nr:hypothetical protein [Myxococcales bacterium]MCB9715486.1 hypothetical protein [Myxococcales bacterium]